MLRRLKTILLLAAIGLMTACSNYSAQNFEYTALEGLERTNEPVNIPSDTTFLTMDEASKELIYQSLDEIGTDADGTASPTDYSYIEAIDSEEEYIQFLQQSQEQASLLYIGFDECPWCKAFSPKINQFASEIDAPVYYYNTRTHEQDATYAKTMQSFGVETVPYVFIIDKGEPKERINHDSSMQQIEDFFVLYEEAY